MSGDVGFVIVCQRCGFTLGPTPTLGAQLSPCIHCGGPVQAILLPVQPSAPSQDGVR